MAVVKRAFFLRLLKKGSSADFPLKKVFLVSLAINFLTVLAVLLIQNYLPPQGPLFYGLAEGEEQLITPLGLTIPSLTAILFLIINASLTLVVKNDFLQKTLILAGFAVTIFSTITTIKIILLVGSF
jgi:hypothetical protein